MKNSWRKKITVLFIALLSLSFLGGFALVKNQKKAANKPVEKTEKIKSENNSKQIAGATDQTVTTNQEAYKETSNNQHTQPESTTTKDKSPSSQTQSTSNSTSSNNSQPAPQPEVQPNPQPQPICNAIAHQLAKNAFKTSYDKAVQDMQDQLDPGNAPEEDKLIIGTFNKIVENLYSQYSSSAKEANCSPLSLLNLI